MKKFYQYKIVYDADELTIYTYEQEGYFVRNHDEQHKVYSETNDGKNLFFIFKNNLDKIHKHHYFDESSKDGYYEIIYSTEYEEEKDKFNKYEIQDKVKTELEKVVKEKLNEIKSFINTYEQLIQNKKGRKN